MVLVRIHKSRATLASQREPVGTFEFRRSGDATSSGYWIRTKQRINIWITSDDLRVKIDEFRSNFFREVGALFQECGFSRFCGDFAECRGERGAGTRDVLIFAFKREVRSAAYQDKRERNDNFYIFINDVYLP